MGACHFPLSPVNGPLSLGPRATRFRAESQSCPEQEVPENLEVAQRLSRAGRGGPQVAYPCGSLTLARSLKLWGPSRPPCPLSARTWPARKRHRGRPPLRGAAASASPPPWPLRSASPSGRRDGCAGRAEPRRPTRGRLGGRRARGPGAGREGSERGAPERAGRERMGGAGGWRRSWRREGRSWRKDRGEKETEGQRDRKTERQAET